MNNRVYQGHLARKRFGQNFLCDNAIINAIVAAIDPQPNQAIVEIGPGLGALTKAVLKRIDKMTVIELDRNLASRLAKHPSSLQSKLKVIQQDAMKVDFSSLASELGKPLRLFGNLPYNISTPFIFHLIKYTHAIQDMHFTLQKEIVNRLIATQHSKAYGRLSIILQYHCQIISLLEVPPTSFRPISKVNSALVQMLPYTAPPIPVKDLNKLVTLTNLAFNQRRKMLHNSLKNLFSTKELMEQGIKTTWRAENLSTKDYYHLANILAERFI